MITIPLYIILFIYLAYLLIVMSFYYVNFSHLIHNGALDFITFLFTFFIIALTVFCLYLTFVSLMGTNWQEPITIWNSDWIKNTLNPSVF